MTCHHVNEVKSVTHNTETTCRLCFCRVPLCCPLLTMQSACTVLVALAAAAAFIRADPESHRARHDSNLEICILLLPSVCV